MIRKENQLFALVDCEEFKKIRHLHIFFHVGFPKNIHFEKSVYSNKPEDADRKYVADVLNAFPAVSFTLEYVDEISSEKAI